MEGLSSVPLRALVELSRRGTITAVAGELGYTPGAVSQQLARLETVVGQPLLVKVGRGVRLTDVGRVLAAHAVEILHAEGVALAAARAAHSEVLGDVTVGVFGSTAAALLAPLVARLEQDHPGVTLMSREVGVDDAAAAVRRGDVDIAFGVDYPTAPMPREDDTELIPLGTEHFGLAVPRDLAAEPVIHLSAVREAAWILTPETTPFGRAIRTACRSAGFEPHVVHEVTDTAAALQLATRGLGITPVTPLMRRLVTVPATVLHLNDPIERTITLIRHRADHARPTIAAVTEAARAVAREALSPEVD
jgi:DNA-binding transcriptional LysR family regulator